VGEESRRKPLIGCAVVAGLAPDLDALSLFGGMGCYVRYHQTLTHNLLVLPFLMLAVSYIFWRHHGSGYRQLPVWLGFAALGAGWHLLLDWTISWGLALFWPFSSRTFCLGLILLTDPLFLLLCTAGCYAIFRLSYWHHRRLLVLLVFSFLFFHFLLRYLLLHRPHLLPPLSLSAL
jgi:inner membrane protein